MPIASLDWSQFPTERLKYLRQAAVPRALLSGALACVIVTGADLNPTRLGWLFALVLVEVAHWSLQRSAARALTEAHDPGSMLLLAALLPALPWLALLWLPGNSPDLAAKIAVALPALILVGTIAFATHRIGQTLYTSILTMAAAIAAAQLDSAAIFWWALPVVLLTSWSACWIAQLIAERIHNRLELRINAETIGLLLREVESSATDWLWQVDEGRRIVRPSPQFAHTFDIAPEALEGLPFLQLLAGSAWESGNFAEGLRRLAEHLKARESFRDLLLPVTIGDRERWFELSASPREEKGVFAGFRGVASDVTEARTAANRVHDAAYLDPVTKFPNRTRIFALLDDVMQETEKWDSRCAVVVLGFERSALYEYGRAIQDQVFAEAAGRLREFLDGNVLLGRSDRNEFVALVRDVPDEGYVGALAEKMLATLTRPYEIYDAPHQVEVAAGFATAPRDGRTSAMLLRSADLALHEAHDVSRAPGEAPVARRYEPKLHSAAEERRVLEIALRGAVERSEFLLLYQPIVRGDGSLVRFEALVRWNSPEYGMVSPARFIPLAEDARLIGEIGAWVLDTACEEAARWPGAVGISVNLSPYQLDDPAFPDLVTKILDRAAVAPQRVTFEVTEAMFFRSEHVGQLDRIAALGVQFALDDFGTGYSSIGYVARAKFNAMKLDRSIVVSAAMGTAPAIATVRAAVGIATSFDMDCIAEGIENQAELAAMADFGCTMFQGYYFGRPMPASDVRALMHKSGGDLRCAAPEPGTSQPS